MVVLGLSYVGKSAICINFTSGKFYEKYDPTADDTYLASICVDQQQVQFSILDTPGVNHMQPREHYFHFCNGFLVVYAINSNTSFLEVQDLVQQIQRVKELDFFPLVVLGNKCDLETQREVSTQQGILFAEMLCAPFFETSAKFGKNIIAAFQQLANEISVFENSVAPPKKTCVIC